MSTLGDKPAVTIAALVQNAHCTVSVPNGLADGGAVVEDLRDLGGADRQANADGRTKHAPLSRFGNTAPHSPAPCHCGTPAGLESRRRPDLHLGGRAQSRHINRA